MSGTTITVTPAGGVLVPPNGSVSISNATDFAIALTGYALKPTGTPDGTKFYRDDGTWAVPAGGGGGALRVGSVVTS